MKLCLIPANGEMTDQFAVKVPVKEDGLLHPDGYNEIAQPLRRKIRRPGGRAAQAAPAGDLLQFQVPGQRADDRCGSMAALVHGGADQRFGDRRCMSRAMPRRSARTT